MAEDEEKSTPETFEPKGLILFKEGMATFINAKGEAVAGTVLKYEPLFVTQIKTKEKEGYNSIQVSGVPRPKHRANRPQKGHTAKAGFVETAFRHVAEFRQEVSDGVKLGARCAIETLKEGSLVKVTGFSKGRGFAGSVKRYGFGGGPAAHGSKFHRSPGSSGNRTWPGRVMPGKKFPGQYGAKQVYKRGVEVLKVLPEENVVVLKGSVPGGRRSVVRVEQ